MNDEGKRTAIELIRTASRETDALFRSLDAGQLARPVFTGEGPGWHVRDLMPGLEHLRMHRAHIDKALKEARSS